MIIATTVCWRSKYLAFFRSRVFFGVRGCTLEDRRRIASKGSAGSVMMVRETNSGKIFAAKKLWFKITDSANIRRKRWKELTKKYQKIIKFKHVSYRFKISVSYILITIFWLIYKILVIIWQTAVKTQS